MRTYLRRHWMIENGIFRGRDVSYDEDGLHAHKIGPAFFLFRNEAINLLLYFYGSAAQRNPTLRSGLRRKSLLRKVTGAKLMP